MAIANFLNQVKASGGKLFLQFGGQGSPFLKEISKLYESEPSLKEFFDVSFKAIAEEVPKLDKKSSTAVTILKVGLKIQIRLRTKTISVVRPFLS